MPSFSSKPSFEFRKSRKRTSAVRNDAALQQNQVELRALGVKSKQAFNFDLDSSQHS
jgi:hypothetical protein